MSEPVPGEDIVHAAVTEGPSGGSCNKLLPFEPSHFTRCELGPVQPGVYLEPTHYYWLYTDDSGRTPRGEVWRNAYENIYYDEQQQQWIVEQFPDTRIATLSGVTIDQTGGPEIYVVATTALHVGLAARLDILGSRPLAWVAIGDVFIEGEILAQSGANDPITCASATGTSGTLATDPTTGLRAGDGGGGAASAFGSGGDGGAGQGGSKTPGGSIAGVTGLVGGCSGGDGGGKRDHGSTVRPSDGGSGGGALQLVAGRSLRIAATRTDYDLGIESSGQIIGDGQSGGNGSGAIVAETLDTVHVEYPTGGGGGGSGGMLVLEAVDIEHAGFIWADGGAGGNGGSFTYPISGPPGGSAGSPDGGDGNPGNATSTTAGSGGGGGAGRIVLRATNAVTIAPEAFVSPPPTP